MFCVKERIFFGENGSFWGHGFEGYIIRLVLGVE